MDSVWNDKNKLEEFYTRWYASGTFDFKPGNDRIDMYHYQKEHKDIKEHEDPKRRDPIRLKCFIVYLNSRGYDIEDGKVVKRLGG